MIEFSESQRKLQSVFKLYLLISNVWENLLPNIWIFFSLKLKDVCIISITSQQVYFFFKLGTELDMVSIIYDATPSNQCLVLWKDLIALSKLGPWFIA